MDYAWILSDCMHRLRISTNASLYACICQPYTDACGMHGRCKDQTCLVHACILHVFGPDACWMHARRMGDARTKSCILHAFPESCPDACGMHAGCMADARTKSCILHAFPESCPEACGMHVRRMGDARTKSCILHASHMHSQKAIMVYIVLPIA